MNSRTSIRDVCFAPLILCGAMVLCAFVTGQLAGVNARYLYLPYLSTSLAITFVSLLLTLFWWVLQLARVRADSPLRVVKERLRERAPYLLLPAFIFPLFFASFTATKTAIPFLVGYSWDPFWAQADRIIFGDDAWRITQHWLGNRAALPLEWSYALAWGIGLIFVMALVPLNASARFTSKFYTALMASWLIGGVGLAYALSAAGPVFANLVTNHRGEQFADLHAFLSSNVRSYSPIRLTQDYLAAELHSHIAVKGGGISAMPSMHLATVTIYILGARRTPWLIPSILFWILIFVGSAYFGYHYWIDGLVAALVAGIAWVSADKMLPKSAIHFDIPRAIFQPGQVVGEA